MSQISQQLPGFGPKPRSSAVWWIVAAIIVFVAFPVVSVMTAALLQTFVYKPYQIPTESMLPTIRPGDRIIVDRYFYRHLPVQRGDIVAFTRPPWDDQTYVKRVIGRPGDVVEVRHGVVLVNGSEFIVDGASAPSYTYPRTKVPAGMLFVLGDNRDESSDSHVWGYVPIDDVTGRVDGIYWPPDSLAFFPYEKE